jgi:hypothetical protein
MRRLQGLQEPGCDWDLVQTRVFEVEAGRC